MRETAKTGGGHLDRPVAARWVSLALGVLVVVLLLLAVLLLPLHFVSYGKAKMFFAWYAARHGAYSSTRNVLSTEAYGHFIDRLPMAAGVFGICGIVLALFRKALGRFLLELPPEWKEFCDYFRRQFSRDTETVLEIGTVAMVFGTGIFLRLHYLGRPVRFDEAWTYMDFAARPLGLVLSRYPAPNDHLLNTLLIHFSTVFFGNTVLGLRFPALLAGCLVIPATWILARIQYGPAAGILAAGAVAALPTFIEFSVNARGYSLQWLLLLGVMLFAVMLVERRSLRWAWLGLVAAAVAGVYTIPTTVLAVAGIFCWMLACAVFDRQVGAAGTRQLLASLGLASVAIGLLSLLLYLPPLLVSGPSAMAAQSVVTLQQQVGFVDGLKHLGGCALVYWTGGVPTTILWILMGGLLTGLLLHHKISHERVPMIVPMGLVAAIFTWNRQAFGFPRVWSYLLLSAVLTAAAGISLALGSLAGRSRRKKVALGGATAVGLVVCMAVALVHQRVLFSTNETGTIPDAEEIARFLSTELHPGDALVGNALIEYVLLQRNPGLYGALAKPQNASRVVAVVMKRTGNLEICSSNEQAAELAAQETANPEFLRDSIDLARYQQPEVRAKFLTSTVYSLESKKAAE